MSILGMGGGGGADGGSDLGSSFGASFKEFCEHPDNRELMMKHQAKELRQMEKATAQASALEFRDRVMESDYEAQNNVAPFLENKVLRRIIKTFTNDPKGDFTKWARNPLVIQMLTRAKDMIEQGRISEEEAEHLIVQSLKQPGSEGGEEFKAKTERKMKVETKDLAET